jgi:DNA invertase Pin-like site-specific DNA recombinase
MSKHQGKFVSYLRVSTARQGESGLGLEAQRKAVLDYLNGGAWELIGEYVEVETGKGSNALARRPQLVAALAAAKKAKATLIVAKLDRLARNVAFVAAIMEAGVDFVAVDNPHANKLTLHILAAVAEHERDMISERTKAALAAAKARGRVLGSHGKVLAAKNKEDARARVEALRETLDAVRTLPIRKAVEALNAGGVPSPGGGGRWHPTSLQRALKQLADIDAE